MDFSLHDIIKLRQCKISDVNGMVKTSLVGGEIIMLAFTADNGKVVFTNKRIVYVELIEDSAEKLTFTSIPYKRIAAFSVENQGSAGSSGHLKFEIAGLGSLNFEVVSTLENINLNKIISGGVLSC